MWLRFQNQGPTRGLGFPVAIKVAAGKINAVTGEAWRPGLHRDPQDYVVSPEQPWLDGFAVRIGVIRQFVAMPLGDGYSVEEQLTGQAAWAGLQISVAPLKAAVWRAKRAKWVEEQKTRAAGEDAHVPFLAALGAPFDSMGLAAGGQMGQVIHPDPFDLDDWDFSAADRVFVTLVHARDWKHLTGDLPPNEPPTAKEYSQAGLPWFEHYGDDRAALPGSEMLAGVKSVSNQLPNSEDIETGGNLALFGGRQSRGLNADGSNRYGRNQMPLRIIVCGGREYHDSNHVWRILDALDQAEGIDALAHGGAVGVDSEAERWAEANCKLIHVFDAEWNTHGRSAGPRRNQLMLDEFKPDAVVALPGGMGTADMVQRARNLRVRVIET